jgi:hypothetical protein
MTGLGLDLSALYQQGLNFLLQQAANWSRIPTRLRRAEAARLIVERAADQRNDAATVNTMRATRDVLGQVQRMYDNGSGKIADVVDRYRAVPQGSLPPLDLAPKAAEVAALVATVTATLTEIERQVAASSTEVLTPEQQTQLNSGLKFPSFLGGQAMQWLKYAVIGGLAYFMIRALGRSGGTKGW